MQFNVPHADRHNSGVYIIRSTVDEHVYVGATRRLRGRFLRHRRLLSLGEHINLGLQTLATTHGLSALSFDLVELCAPELLRQREAHYIALQQSKNAASLLNIVVEGWKMSEESRAKRRGRRVDEETRAKISRANKGRVRNAEWSAKQSAARKAHWAKNPEAKNEFREMMKQHSYTPEVVAKRNAALRGKKRSDETVIKMREAAKISANTPEAQARRHQRYGSPEAKAAFVEKMRRGREARASAKKKDPSK